MEKQMIAKILAEAYHQGETIDKWEMFSEEEQQRWLNVVNVLETEAEKLPD